MAMPVVALLLTGGDGIADDGDGIDSDCGEDKLHNGGKLHDGGSHVSTMGVSFMMEVSSTMEVSFTTLCPTNVACGHTVPKSISIQTLCPRVLQWRQPCDDMLDNSRSSAGGCIEIASVSDAVWLLTLNISELTSSGGHKRQDLSLLWLDNA